MFLLEFVADKIPGVDTLWDGIQTFIRIPAGAALAAGVFGATGQCGLDDGGGDSRRLAGRDQPLHQSRRSCRGQRVARAIVECRTLGRRGSRGRRPAVAGDDLSLGGGCDRRSRWCCWRCGCCRNFSAFVRRVLRALVRPPQCRRCRPMARHGRSVGVHFRDHVPEDPDCQPRRDRLPRHHDRAQRLGVAHGRRVLGRGRRQPARRDRRRSGAARGRARAKKAICAAI